MKTTNFSIIFFCLLTLVFVSVSQAQINSYPNELKGYEFFGKGKLKSLKIGVSTVEDVKNALGETCESVCDYDENWTVNFDFFENNWIKTDTDPKGVKTVQYLDQKFLGKLRKIELRPKKKISFRNVVFPSAFSKLSRSEITKNPQQTISKMVTYELFQDSYGLTYELFGAKDVDNTKTREKSLYNKGDLYSVLYNVSKEQEKEMYSLPKNK
ncbi:hypothetical protein BH20ACI1_BH20ACI1_21400 [soil metagenome]